MAKIHPYNLILVKPINKEICFRCEIESKVKKCSYCNKQYCHKCIDLNCCFLCKDSIIKVKSGSIFDKLFKFN